MLRVRWLDKVRERGAQKRKPLLVDREGVPVKLLAQRLGFSESFAWSGDAGESSLAQWRMDPDDVCILRYIYRNLRPCRHLEFGTWQGWGTTACLEECGATVWTINVPFGENKPSGGYAYAHGREELEGIHGWLRRLGFPDASGLCRTDNVGFIGRRYLERSLGHRVCQVYCDSREWDTSSYPAGFFDSALIDGGHSPEVVMNDTDKSLSLVRSGGLVIWHDYCPDAVTMAQHPQVKTLVETMQEALDRLEPTLEDVFWIEPSWLLIGVKK